MAGPVWLTETDCTVASRQETVPLSIRFMQLARMGHYIGALLPAA